MSRNGVMVETKVVGTSVITTHLIHPTSVSVVSVSRPPLAVEVLVHGPAGPPGRRGIFVASSAPTGTVNDPLVVGDIWLRPA